VNTLRSDPFLIVAFAILTAVFCVGVLASWLLHRLSEYLDHQTPAFRKPLEAAYARFHGFLLIVQLAALRRRISRFDSTYGGESMVKGVGEKTLPISFS